MPKVKGGRPTKSDKRSSVTNKKAGTKKAKTSKSRDLVVTPPKREAVLNTIDPNQLEQVKKKARLTKKRLKALQAMKHSQFRGDLPDIADMMDGDSTLDDVQKRFLTSALMVVINLIPELEEKLHEGKNESGTYALKALLAEGREIFHDIRALANTQLIAFRIAETVIDPAFINLANFFVTNFHSLRTAVEDIVPDSDKPELRRLFQNQARLFGENLREIQNEIKEQVAREIE